MDVMHWVITTSTTVMMIAWGLKCFDYPMAVARNMEAAQTVSMYVNDYIFGFNKAGIGQAAAIIITVVLVVITQCITSIGAKLEVISLVLCHQVAPSTFAAS